MSLRVAALLAAGGGTRFGGPTHKLLAELDGRPVWEHAMIAVATAGFDHIIVVTGAVGLTIPGDVATCHLDSPREVGGPPHVELRHNPEWRRGQAGSVQMALAAADALGADALTIGLADQPFVPSSAWTAVADAAADCRIVIATYGGIPGPNPVRLHRSVWPLLPTDGDEGARGLLRSHPEWVCHVPCIGSLDTVADIDTPEDLHRWKSS